MNDLRLPDVQHIVAQMDHYERIEAAELARSLRDEARQGKRSLFERLLGLRPTASRDTIHANN
jgi:hypothetical protein